MTGRSRQSKPLQGLLDQVAATAIYDSSQPQFLPRCHPATRLEVQRRLLGWAQSKEAGTPQKRILWLSGQTGGGKTTIMNTVAYKLKRAGDLAASFSFSSCSGHRERRIKDHFVTTLVFQLIQHKSIGHIKCLRKSVLSSIEKDPSILTKSLKEQMEVLLLAPIRDCERHLQCRSHFNCRLPSHYHSECHSHSACRTHSNHLQARYVIVVDGVDECRASKSREGLNDPERLPAQSPRQQDQTEILSVLLDAAKEAACPFRIILATQPDPVIKHFFSSCKHYASNIVLDDTYDSDADIALFLTSKFGQIRLDHPQISQVWPGESTILQLVHKASGQFIYAATVIRFVETSISDPPEQLDLILNLSNTSSSPLETLHNLYAALLRSTPNPLRVRQWLKAYDRLDVAGFGPETAWFWCKLCESFAGEATSLFEHIPALLSVSNLDAPSMAQVTFYHKSFQDFLADPHQWGVHFPGMEHERFDKWLTERLDMACQGRPPEVQISDPYYSNVFNAIAPLYRRSLVPSDASVRTGGKPDRKKRSKAPTPSPQAFKGLESDIVVLVMGDSGSGKSSLVNRLAGWGHMAVKRKAESDPRRVQVATVEYAPERFSQLNDALGGRRIVLVDTPDFDDQGDHEGLGCIIQWLCTTYLQGMCIRGILYLHDVSGTSDRWKTRRRNLRILSQLCGKGALNRVSLVSSRWDKVHSDLVEEKLRNLDELRRGGGVWAPLVKDGASVCHLSPVDGHHGAVLPANPRPPDPQFGDPWAILGPFITKIHADLPPLLVQDELVDRHLAFERSTIGQSLGIVWRGIPGGIAVTMRKAEPGSKPGVPLEGAQPRGVTSARLSIAAARLKRWVRENLSGRT